MFHARPPNSTTKSTLKNQGSKIRNAHTTRQLSESASGRSETRVAWNQSSVKNNQASGNNNGRLTGRTAKNRDGQTQAGKWARNNNINKSRFDRQTQEKMRNWKGQTASASEAKRRNQANHGRNHTHNGSHDRDWWHRHCPSIIWVDWGWWGWWDGWWYPAWGYDPYYSTYEYDGPIYGYGGLPPDEVVANVQTELQQRGFYTYSVDGKFGPQTQAAVTRYQQSKRLPVTGTIDPATVGSLGLAN